MVALAVIIPVVTLTSINGDMSKEKKAALKALKEMPVIDGSGSVYEYTPKNLLIIRLLTGIMTIPGKLMHR